MPSCWACIGTLAGQLDAWQRERAWGTAAVEQMALDLQASYPGMKGFSRTSLFAIRQF
ncbi:DUF1016 N-terminal domain-containing protein [Paucibacter sp. M5-1]|uniref:DUF1016 N-terminal domain-containing protein n=1 Tax=Paucibacter sp. M5-1 TaxID=3015998 RepID=UPI0022B87D09|nr:DUF1016 N-terminal domain-containing protein [Paucibacter sp. M5-1]MCZ7881859.1 DUF1016 N-terminal domain-containing protein [Paucibacter sp. M5-1]